ncbi:histidinol phosphate aminotransferase [Citreimonas salinaria]|uniref:Uncharacterized protein n=1 Tax=Citreimonas salinaria TaxID=321339 RepID=A0A1H3NJV5_9RHOB|nr:histidinol phosphate aminotransferase [Citreimonas salinaria]SDY89033.1 hypothetical protein SAMN05444340_12518 [Citreimonas salinaria]
MDDGHFKRVEDYTNANLVLILMNLMWIFGVIWTYWGLFPVVVLGFTLNHLITRAGVVRARRLLENAPRPVGIDLGDGGV